MASLTFLYPAWLPATVMLLVLAWVCRSAESDDDWRRVMSVSVLAFLRQASPSTGRRISWGLLGAAVCTLALSSPVSRTETDNLLRNDSLWLVLLDVSRSMQSNDVLPSRLSAARSTLLRLSKAAGSRSLGLIVYAGDAFLAAPPAYDKRFLEEQAGLIDYGIVPLDGSNLSRALALATSVVADSEVVSGRIFLLSDSGGINKTSIAAARHLHTQGQRLDVLSYGASSGDPNISVKLEEIKALTDAGGGEFLQASGFGELDLDKLDLDRAAASELASSELTALQWRNQSHWILLFMLPVVLMIFYRQSHG